MEMYVKALVVIEIDKMGLSMEEVKEKLEEMGFKVKVSLREPEFILELKNGSSL